MVTIMISLAVAVLLVLLPVSPAAAQARTVVDIEAAHSLIVEQNGAGAVSATKAGIDFQGGDNTVRGRLRLEATAASVAGQRLAILQVPRAEIRWRLPVGTTNVRLTTGLTRLSWGDGTRFNAGDVITGERPRSVDLTAAELRTETQWLSALYVPLGPYAFIEAVALLPSADLLLAAAQNPAASELVETLSPETDIQALLVGLPSAGASSGLAAAAPGAWLSGGGARLHGQVGSLKVESGYLYRGTTQRHYPYLSIQGNVVVDWYAAVSTVLPDDPLDDLVASAGLYHVASVGHRLTVTGRLEALYRASDQQTDLYPELTVTPSQLISFFARATVNPAEAESISSYGVIWRPATGLDVVGSLTACTAGASGSDSAGAAIVSVAARYSF